MLRYWCRERNRVHSVTTDNPRAIVNFFTWNRPTVHTFHSPISHHLAWNRNGESRACGASSHYGPHLWSHRWNQTQARARERVLLDNRTGTTTTTTRMCSFLPWRYLWIELRLRGGYLHDPCAPFICETETWITTVLCPVAPAARASWFPDLPCPRRFLCRAGPRRSTGTSPPDGVGKSACGAVRRWWARQRPTRGRPATAICTRFGCRENTVDTSQV